jgi:hypothetical protein
MTYTPPVDSPPLRDDLFPSKVHVVDGAHDDYPAPLAGATNYIPKGATLLYQPARVLISAEHVWIFVDSADGPALLFQAAMDDVQGDRRQGYRITTTPSASNPDPEHVSLVVTRYANCGCGSRLRSFRPFRDMRLIA